jgi:DNA-binding CsgD family transcriptional regulator
LRRLSYTVPGEGIQWEKRLNFVLGRFYQIDVILLGSGEIYLRMENGYKKDVMPLASLLVFFLALAAVGGPVWLARKLQRTSRQYFVSSFTAFLLAFNVAGLLSLVVGDLAGVVLKDLPPASMAPVYILFGLVALPLLALAYYLYIDFIVGLLDEEIRPGLQVAYILIWAGLGIVFILRAQAALSGRPAPVFQTLGFVSGIVSFMLPFAALGYLAVRSLGPAHARERRNLLTFAGASAASFILYFFSLIVVEAGTPLRLAVPAALFAANAGPLLILRRLLARNFPPVLPGVFEGPAADLFLREFQVSSREGEILSLLLKGKSNKQIEAELFISPHTVRNHVHNIYKKLGVSNRLQLLNLVRSRLKAGVPNGI